MATTTTTEAPGVINAAECYTLAELMRRFGLTKSGLRQARRDGLVLRRWGKRTYVTGADVLAFLEKCKQVE
jgi:DNA-binding FadR family transcriptional regulator